MTNGDRPRIGIREPVIDWAFVIRHFSSRAPRGFTIVETLVVMAIILVLASLVLATSSYVHNRGARSRAEVEIVAMSAALENFKADHGVYPVSGATDALNAQTSTDPGGYQSAATTLYQSLAGDSDADGQPGPGVSYMAFKPNQLSGSLSTTFVKDPFGNSYGYSTAGQAGTNGAGYNPTFDLWSTSGSTIDGGKPGWIKNW
jgi:prepilin-type N-terminal cleavage/methylation domain-containing protein